MARELPAYVSGWCGGGHHCDSDDSTRRCRGSYGGTNCHCACHATAGATTTITLFETVQA
jgi:hypothetical protein